MGKRSILLTVKTKLRKKSGINSIYKAVITMTMAAVLIMSSGLIYVDAAGPSGLDEYIASGIVGGDNAGSGDAAETEEPEEPRLEAGPQSFAEALAQEYSRQKGSFILTKDSRFYIVADEEPDKDLVETVRLIDSQFAAYAIPSDKPLPVVYGKKDFALKGDIVVNLVDEEDFLPGIQTADPEETYRIDVDETAAVEACGQDGIWYGLTGLMQLFREKQNAEQENAVVLDKMRIKDGPDLKERALMLDCGRKYYSKEWIENLIKRASLQRYNAIILHFAEAEGIRFDSEVFPWLTENIDSLTTEDMKEIVETAHRYHMEVIPSFDTPGHNTFMVERYASYVKSDPDFSFTYDGKTYDSSVDGFSSIANHYSHGGETEKADYIGIDLTREHAVAFTNTLIEGYADYFSKLGCSKFDIGSDELLGWYTFELGGDVIDYDNRWTALEHWKSYARNTLGIEKGSARDVLVSYINDLAGRLEKKGYTCRVFNDEIDVNRSQHVELKDSIEVTYWFDADNTAAHFAEKGHTVHNFMESWCFYVLRSENGKDIMNGKYKTVNGRNIYENWNPRSFARKAGKSDTVPEDRLGGGYFAIWCDFPDYKGAGTVWAETEFKTWANASRMWNAEVNSAASGIRNRIPYDDMKAFAAGLNGFPGYTGDPEVNAELPDAPQPEDGMSWWQRLTSK